MVTRARPVAIGSAAACGSPGGMRTVHSRFAMVPTRMLVSIRDGYLSLTSDVASAMPRSENARHAAFANLLKRLSVASRRFSPSLAQRPHGGCVPEGHELDAR